MPTVTIFAPQLCHQLETVAYFLDFEGRFQVRLATSDEGKEGSEHQWSFHRAVQFGAIEIADFHKARTSDVLIFCLVRHGRLDESLTAWRRGSSRVYYLLSAPGCPYSWRDWARETVRSFPEYLSAKRIGFAPYVHPHFLTNPAWRKAAFEVVEPARTRKWRIGFMGNRHPPERARRLAQCKAVLSNLDVSSYWNEYGSPGETRGSSWGPMEYIQRLSDTDFCISPPGWGLCYTHRTIEALLRGSIPIIEDPCLYDLPLQDSKNCLVAEADDWQRTIKRAINMPETEILRMRQNINELRENRLIFRRAAERFYNQLSERN